VVTETINTYQKITRYDPTHTTRQRNAFAREVKSRFKSLKNVIVESVVKNDCFGLSSIVLHQNAPAGWRAFAFVRDEQKINEFLKWLDQQVKDGILTVRDIEEAVRSGKSVWYNKYVVDTYKRGLMRAKQELKKSNYKISEEEWKTIEASLNVPVHVGTLALIYTRVFSELKGITSQMSTQISQVLAQGLADGDGPRLLARKLVATIDGTNMGSLGITDTLGRFIPAERRALMLARTELIRAHHLAMVNVYREWSVEGVRIVAEWLTAGDERVCGECHKLEGKIFTLDEVEGMIPLHPQCRCIILPALVKD